MFARPRRLIFLLPCLLFAASVLAQEGHPLKGTWVGEWDSTPTEQNHVVVLMDWDGKNITGFVNPGRNAAPIKLARLDITPGTASTKPGGPRTDPIFKVHFEADAKDAKGNPVNIVADGTIAEAGLPSRSISGTWNQTSGGNTVKGHFTIRRQ